MKKFRVNTKKYTIYQVQYKKNPTSLIKTDIDCLFNMLESIEKIIKPLSTIASIFSAWN